MGFVALEIPLYYGCRMLIIELSKVIPRSTAMDIYLIHPIHLIGYGIFFLFNGIIYYGIEYLADQSTEK